MSIGMCVICVVPSGGKRRGGGTIAKLQIKKNACNLQAYQDVKYWIC